ncbi:cupin [Amycolatopsis sp. WAC 01416]|uniref:cupin domain-containing protein n=1 Tax=Amycolatopsis sp. WAC 01416 TaxID=2203196 RepID=UPI000F7707ED|nr:cupin domain-containing protein [Amycolatopsis sp. WAC 01416]RSN36056.1 cupin [Amycolatopsis sp. WAC 01416]
MTQRVETREPVLVRAAEAETVGTAPTLVTLLADVSTTGGVMSSARTQLGVGADGAAPHYHTGSSEMFFMLDGKLEVLAGEEIVTVAKGDMLVVPPLTTHAFRAAADSPADVLIVFIPGVERFGYFRLLEKVGHGEATVQDLLDSQEKFDNHFVESPVWTESAKARQ